MSNLSTTLPRSDDTLALNDIELPTATLITEQQVRFSTAVALSPSIQQPTRGARLVAAMRRMFAASDAPRQQRRDVARRYSYLEDALMAREMHRL